MLQACLNGSRSRSEHPAVPISPPELAAAARGAVDAGADELHVHPRGADESDTLEPGPVAAAVAAIRERCPGVPLGLTTGIWAAGGDPDRRLEFIRGWEELPDYVSANVGEPVSSSCAHSSRTAGWESRRASGRRTTPRRSVAAA